MRVLGIDTVTPAGSVALVQAGEGGRLDVLAEVAGESDQRHAETLLEAVDACLDRAGCTLPEVAGLAVAAGPGSFTGLRVGLATAKGLAFATGSWLVGVPTLEAYARAFLRARRDETRVEERVCVCLDARKGEVYAALFMIATGSEGERVILRHADDAVLSPVDLRDRLLAFLAGGAATLRVVGDGVPRYADQILPDLQRATVVELVASATLPRGVAVAQIAAETVRRDGVPDGVDLVPLYLRASEAEIKQRQREALASRIEKA